MSKHRNKHHRPYTGSPSRQQIQARQQMKEIMETYAPLIYSASIKYDPLVNVNFTETFSSNSTNQSNN